MPNIFEMINILSSKVKNTEKDALKFDGGNATAGVRVRKNMQEIKKYCKSIRKQIQSTKKKRRNVKKAETN